MKLALQLAWEHRARWAAMLVLTAVSGLVLMLGLHSAAGYQIALDMQQVDSSAPKIDVYISVIATFLIVQSIAALCLESQARDLAVIKTCGASTRALRWTLRAEVFIVTALGFLLGLAVLPFIVDPYVIGVVQVQSDITIPGVGVVSNLVVDAFIILVVAVFIGSWATLKNVSRQNVVDALQGEGLATRKRPRALRWVVAVITVLMMAGMVFLMNNMDLVLKFSETAPSEIRMQVLGLPMMVGVLFCLTALAFIAAVAPDLYQKILGFITRRMPKSTPAELQVGFNLARYNAAKYSGSITPIVAFITVVIMMFTVMDASAGMVMSQLKAAGVDTSNITETNYEGVANFIGPAVAIAIVGSLCTIVMSGHNRIYVNKLTGVIGASSRQRLKQSLLEMGGYVALAAIVSLIIMLAVAALVMLGNTKVSGVQQEFLPSWLPWIVTVVISFVIMIGPALYAQARARRLASKSVLETFGE